MGQCDALFSIMLILWIVIGVFIVMKIREQYHKNRFNNNGSLVNNNDFANDEFLNAHYSKPSHAMKTINNDNDSKCDCKQSLEDQCSGLQAISHNSQFTNNDIPCNDD